MCRPDDFPPYDEPSPERRALLDQLRQLHAAHDLHHGPGAWPRACLGCAMYAAVQEAPEPAPRLPDPPSPERDAPGAPQIPGLPLFRQLGHEAEASFRSWAREHHAPGQPISPLWHPVVQSECEAIDREGDAHG